MIIQEGIVLRERLVGEHDKFLDVLTKNSGIIEVSAKGAGKIGGKSRSSAQLFAYSRFCMDRRGSRYYLNSAEPIHIFYGLRDSLTKIALASYFSEVLTFCINEECGGAEIMRLILNTLHYLENGKRNQQLLKSVFELRLMSEIGFMPDIVGCRMCGIYEPDTLYFSEKNSCFYCADCFDGAVDKDFTKIKLPVLSAVRHIVLADFNRLFNFRISDSSMMSLAAITENYLIVHLERNFQTLNYYKDVRKIYEQIS